MDGAEKKLAIGEGYEPPGAGAPAYRGGGDGRRRGGACGTGVFHSFRAGLRAGPRARAGTRCGDVVGVRADHPPGAAPPFVEPDLSAVVGDLRLPRMVG